MKRMASGPKSSKSNVSSRDTRPVRGKKTVAVALCVRPDKDCGDLHLGTLYPLLRDAAAAKEGYVRIIDDSGEDYLYPVGYFVPLRLPVSLAKRIRQRA
jgi:hypothetical protein